MNTNNLKRFAKEARIKLMQGVKQRLAFWGIDTKGNLVEEVEKTPGGYIFRGEAFNDPTVPNKWHNLKMAIRRHSVTDVIEEAAYTWFNRLLAIKILEKNSYISPVLEFVSQELHDPAMLHNARRGSFLYVRETDRETLDVALRESNDEVAFAVLLKSYCNGQPLIKRLFGQIDDYTELLLPTNLLANDGVIDFINTTEAISPEDYKQVELIGWLYQFYISDKKDEVFAGFKNNKKARPEDIPAATQIFTPKWIVKYMVENTVGRIWLDKYPNSPIRREMKYLVEPGDPENYQPEPIINDITELTLLDPAVGSGHILVEGFDLLLKMYLEAGYSTKNAVETILKHNLFGLDIDKRATQLANFAVFMKAAQYHAPILEQEIEPHIYAMPEAREFSKQEIYTFLAEKAPQYAEALEDNLKKMQDAQNIGSALILDLPKELQLYLKEQLNDWAGQNRRGALDLVKQAFYQHLRKFIWPMLILADKYFAVVTNPPYMIAKNMNANLSSYTKKKYLISKPDLFAVFMERSVLFNKQYGFLGMINQHSWMFLGSFEDLRKYIINNFTIICMLHLGPRIFDELSGEVVQSTCFVLKKECNEKYKGDYFRLVDFKSSNEKEKQFILRNHHYNHIEQSNFEKIPGIPIVYWLSKNSILNFSNNKKLGDFCISGGRIKTHGNESFMRFFWEVNHLRINDDKHWNLYENGGESLKWFGNLINIVKWTDDARKRYKLHGGLTQKKFWKKKGITWNNIGKCGFRFKDVISEYSSVSPTAFPIDDNQLFFYLGFLNSKYAFKLIEIINPTLSNTIGDIFKLPIKHSIKDDEIIALSFDSVNISKRIWDSNETSWNFKKSVFLNNSVSLVEAYQFWFTEVSKTFFILHNNEEKINKIFIEIYGIDDEMSPDVALKDITILHEEIDQNKLEKLNIVFLKNSKDIPKLPVKMHIVITKFLSYSIGCFMGRYRLDKPGLNIAHPNPSEEELAAYVYNGKPFEIDEDAIIPLMGLDSPFSDDIVLRVKEFVHTIWGEKTLTENLNFINEALGMELEKFLTTRFWDFHKKMYKKRPIYWLFASPKGAFKVLVYMHRMNKFTVQKIRQNYLLKYLNYLASEIQKLKQNEALLSREETKRLDNLRKAEIECREYDKLVKDFADRQIEFDLDDGVIVNYAKFEPIVAKI